MTSSDRLGVLVATSIASIAGIAYALSLGKKDSAPKYVDDGPAPDCKWMIPTPQEVQMLGKRATEILRLGEPLGTEHFERINGRFYKFRVEIHGPNEFNPANHRGVGARVCVVG